MKSALIPQVRVEPELRADLEAVLGDNETLSDFVEASVRGAVQYRLMQSRFLERGEVALQRFNQTGESFSADEVRLRLQAKVDSKRKQLSP